MRLLILILIWQTKDWVKNNIMIRLTDLLKEEKAFTATNKETGNVSVFKTKAARDAAVKAGSHEKRKTDKDDAVDVPTGEKKPNMFSKDTGYDAPDAKSDDTPKVTPRKANKVLVKTVDKFSERLGLTPDKLGKEDYEKKMLTLVHDALEDANFHSANRQIFADLYGKPELAKRPDYSEAPEFGTPERDEWEEKNSIYGKRFDSATSNFDDSDEMVGAITSQDSWDGQLTIDAILDKMRRDGSNELADKIQSSFDKDMAKHEDNLKLGDLI